VNPQYAYGWAVPFLCLYLLWKKDHETTRPRDHGTTRPETVPRTNREDAKEGRSETARPQDYETADHASRLTHHVSPFSFSAFQLFSFFILCLLYLPTRLVQEANPEWRLVSWALALEVIGLTLLVLRIAGLRDCGTTGQRDNGTTGQRDDGTTGLRDDGTTGQRDDGTRGRRDYRTTENGRQTTDLGAGAAVDASRFTFHASRFTFALFFFLVAVPWPTFIEGPLVQGLMRVNVGVTTELLGAIGVPAVPHGNVIEVATGMVGVDDACSGIRSFQATLMISLFFGELCALTVRRRVVCVFAGFALSFLFNVGRTTLLTWIAAQKGTGAVASWHDPAGVTILVACFLCLWALAVRLGRVQSPKSKAQIPKAEVDSGGSGWLIVGTHRPKNEVQSPSAQLDVGCPPPTAAAPSTIIAQPPGIRSPVVSWSLLAWLLVVEAGTELWYRSHEWRVPVATAWHVELPRGNATFRELPLSDKTRQFLRYDEGYNGTWQEGANQRWQAIFLRWNPGRIAVHLAKTHTPASCLTAAGRELTSQSGLRAVAVQGLQLPFRLYVVKDESGPLHVFYCLWEDRANAQSFDATAMTYASRLAPVLVGRRNSGQRSLEVAVWGIAGEEEAEAALTQGLQKLIKVGK
jgi:exosortase/archaeosortase family protein